MKLMTREEIIEVLNSDFTYLKTLYNDDRFLGVFTYGKTAQGFIEDKKEMQVVACYLPTFKELCSSRPTPKNILYNDHIIEMRDLRILLRDVIFQELETMECLFSKISIISQSYEKIFKDTFYKNRNEIFSFDKKSLIRNIIQKIEKALNDYEKYSKLDYLFEACRLRLIGTLYLESFNCDNCINLKKDYYTSYLLGVKQGEIKPNIEDIKEELKEMESKTENIEIDISGEDLIKYCATELMRVSSFSRANKDEFLKMLTDMEKQGLKIILTKIKNGEEYISISKLIKESNISRPVFKNILQKMKDNGVAEIENMGVKGTYVKILDGSYLDF